MKSDVRPDRPTRRVPRGRASGLLLSRLMGMETEYATVVLSDLDHAGPTHLPTSRRVYQSIVAAIGRRMPMAIGLVDPDQWFLANGAALSCETHPNQYDKPGGLVELATPEVQGPSELVACQKAIDGLLRQAAADCDLAVDLRILKNSCDGSGHVYGCQENYHVDVASGLWLAVYRAGVLMLWAVQCVTSLAAMPLIWMMSLVFAWQAYRIRPRHEATQSSAVEGDSDPVEIYQSLPPWITRWMVRSIRWLHLPTVWLLKVLVGHVAYRPQRRHLTGFLASRVVLCGSGTLDGNGRFRLSAKAVATDRVVDIGGFAGERPIYVFGHWLNQLCDKSAAGCWQTRKLFSRGQRLQIGLSDSNMSELAQYVKVGSAALMLDMVDAKQTDGLPRLKRPLTSLHRIACDWNLVTRVPTSHGDLTAIEIQRACWKAADAFVRQTPANVRGEAPLVLQRWKQLIDVVQSYRSDAAAITPAIGKSDWLSKRWMLDQFPANTHWTRRKKVDLRYHELSADGYFGRLQQTIGDTPLTSAEHGRRREKSPPSNSPAARRGWTIREFSGGDQTVRIDWSHAVIGSGRCKRVIRFSRAR